jgi:hypothetical protein
MSISSLTMDRRAAPSTNSWLIRALLPVLKSLPAHHARATS